MGIELAVYVEVPIKEKGFSDDNLSSEGRWERLVFESLLSCEEVDNVYSVLPIWKSSHSKPDKFVDGPIRNKINDIITIAPNSWPFNIVPKGIVLNSYYSSFFYYKEFSGFREAIKDNFFVINPYNNYQGIYKGVETFLEDVILPRIPYVKKDNKPFNNKIILWPHKQVFFGNTIHTLEPVFNWVAAKLEEDKEMQFHVLSCMENSSLDFFGFDRDVCKHFFSFKTTDILKKVKDRVIIHKALSWLKVLDIYSKTKISLSNDNSSIYTSGFAQESGMFGVPFIFTSDARSNPSWNNKLKTCAAEWCSKDYFNLMDRLLVDEVFYNKISTLVKEQVQKYTYDNFNKNLLLALNKRGML
jgi:hypothetical protein